MAWASHAKSGGYLGLWSGSCYGHGICDWDHRQFRPRNSFCDGHYSKSWTVRQDHLGSWVWILGLSCYSRRHKHAAASRGDAPELDYWLVSRSLTYCLSVLLSVSNCDYRDYREHCELKNACGLIFSRASITATAPHKIECGL